MDEYIYIYEYKDLSKATSPLLFEVFVLAGIFCVCVPEGLIIHVYLHSLYDWEEYFNKKRDSKFTRLTCRN